MNSKTYADIIFMIGVGYIENGCWKYVSFIAESIELSDEYKIIDQFTKFINDKSLELDSNCAYSLFRRAWTFKSKAKFVEAGIDFELARNLRINDPNFSIEYKKISKLEYIEIDSEPDFVYPFPTLLPLV
jgi:hypothetical protein